jgi:replication factor C subunit 3/5
MNSNFIPWVEKYRPKSLNDIVLDPINKLFFKNIIESKYFPNLLFYGPPGTGKTTSIINLIKSYYNEKSNNNKNLVIHLNASDERGIDIIRNQINTFVNSNSLFNNDTRFVILDEIDYMTKNAQLALRYLLQNYKSDVRFCLICNYISRIDEALQNEFVKIRFNQLPNYEIINHLNLINSNEKLKYDNNTICLIQKMFNSDIRSMINYMQSNQQIIYNNKIIKTELWKELTVSIKNNDLTYNIKLISNISNEYNIDKKNIIKNYLNYIIRYEQHIVNSIFLSFVENIMHIGELNNDYMLIYIILKIKGIL